MLTQTQLNEVKQIVDQMIQMERMMSDITDEETLVTMRNSLIVMAGRVEMIKTRVGA